MTNEAREGELVFDFGKAERWEKFDARPRPASWKAVDFVVEERDRILLVEVKDPSAAMATASERQRLRSRRTFADRLTSAKLIQEEIVPKARCTYCFLHLMNEDRKPFDLVVLIGRTRLEIAREMLLPVQDELLRQLRTEAAVGVSWRLDYVRTAIVVDEEGWLLHFARYPLRRETPPAP